MKTYKVYEVVTTCYCYSVDADSEDDAEFMLDSHGFGECEGISREPEYDDITNRIAQCDGEF